MKKYGLVLFCIAVIWAFLWGIAGSVLVDTTLNTKTMDEVDQTMWSLSGVWYYVWAFGTPLSLLLAAMGVLLYSGTKKLTVVTFKTGIFLAVVVAMFSGSVGHVRPLFGLGGTLILLLFFGILLVHLRPDRLPFHESFRRSRALHSPSHHDPLGIGMVLPFLESF